MNYPSQKRIRWNSYVTSAAPSAVQTERPAMRMLAERALEKIAKTTSAHPHRHLEAIASLMPWKIQGLLVWTIYKTSICRQDFLISK